MFGCTNIPKLQIHSKAERPTDDGVGACSLARHPKTADNTVGFSVCKKIHSENGKGKWYQTYFEELQTGLDLGSAETRISRES